ncbi:MAG: gliding motility-associated C-terminal domain-containing protein [Cyclobacteriaceae bacterium]|nr:gliding motility-associated C-terminal domain-containing protein [Cyclobacteriaceae bacterium]
MRATLKLFACLVLFFSILQFPNEAKAQGCLGADGTGIGGGVARIQNGFACVNQDNALPVSSAKGAVHEVTASNVFGADVVEARINWNDGSGFTAWFPLTDIGGGIRRSSAPKHFFPATNTACEYSPTTELRVNGVVCSTNFGTPPVYFRWNIEGTANAPSSVLSVTNTANAAQTTIEVCAGATTTVSFTDRSNLNCNTNPGDVTIAASLNNRRRWRQFVYGGAGILNSITGGVTVGPTNIAVPNGTAFSGNVDTYTITSGAPVGMPGGDDQPYFNAAYTTPPTPTQTLNITVPATAQAGDQFIVTTRYWNGCNRYDLNELPVEYNQSRILVVAQPSPPTATNQSVCQGTAVNPFTITGVPAGATARFYLNANGAPNSAVLLGTDNTSPYQLPVASYVAGAGDSIETGTPGIYKVWASYIPAVVGATNCESIKIPVTIIIRPTITTPAAITGPNQVCNDNSTLYDFSESSNSPTMTPNPVWALNLVGGTTQYNWSWSDNTGISAIAPSGATNKNLDDVVFNIAAGSFGASASITRTLNVNSSYTNGTPACTTNPNTTLAVTVFRQTAAGSVAPVSGTICAGVTTGTLTLSGHRGSIVRWERIYTPPAGVPGAPEVIANTTTTFSEVPPYGAGTYEYRAVVRNGVCNTVNSGSSIITVNPVPVKPTISEAPTSNGLTICFGQQTVLQSNNPGGLASIYRWYKTTDLVTPVQATASNTLTLTTVAQSGDYVVQVVGIAPSNCASPLSDPVTVTIRALPAVTNVTGGGAACDGNPAPDIIFTFSGGAPYDFTIDVPVGADIVVTGHASNTYTLSGQTDPGNYRITALSNGCVATVLGGSATVTSSGGSPVFDAPRVLTPTSACNAGASTTDPSLTFSIQNIAASGYILTYRIDGGANRTKNFNTDAAGTPTAPLVFTDTELNNVGPHTIRLVSIQSPTGCLGVFNEDIAFTVNALPAAPASGGNVIACSDVIGTATVSATVAGGQTIDWYTAASGGTLLLSGNTTLNPAPANEPTPGNTVTYFAEARNTTTGCISATRTGVTLRSDARPSVPNAGVDFQVCAQPSGPHTATLAATAADNGGTGTWTGPGGVTFGAPNSPTSTVSGLSIGANTLTWTVRSAQSGNAGACANQVDQVIVTVNALPVSNNPAPVLCETVAGTLIALSTDLTTYHDAITGIAGSTNRTVEWFTLASRSPFNKISDPTDVDISTPLTLYTIVTNTVTGCVNQTGIVTFTVVSQPTANAVTFDFCEEFPGGSNQALNIDLTSNTYIDQVTGIVGSTNRSVTWFHTLADANANVNAISNANSYDILSGNETVFARVAITSGTPCVNVAQVDLVIKPRPADPTILGSDNQCVGAIGLYNVPVVAGASYFWEVDDGPGEFSVLTGGGTSDFITVVQFPNVYTGDISVTLEVNGCASNKVTKSVIVNATPPAVVITASSDPVCANQTGVTYTATSLPLTDYTWEIPVIGGATGSSIIGGQGSNQVTVNVGAVSGNIRVTPQTKGGNCPGSPATFFIDVRQRPTMANYSVPAATVCSDSPINIDFTVAGGSVPAPTFRITNVTVPPGLSPSTRAFNPATPVLSTEIHNDAFTNTTGGNLDVRYTVVPVSADGCEGAARDIFARIRPEPVLAPNLVATVCSGDANGLVFTVASGSIPADQFEITSIVNAAGLTSTAGAPTTGFFGPNEIADDVWINTTGVQQEIQYFVRPINTTTGCVGDPAIPVRVLVNPQPVVTSALINVICSGEAPSLTLTSSIVGSTFQWTLKSTTGLITGGGSGTGPTITNILVNGGVTAGTATYEIVATGPVGSGSCPGDPVDLVVTVNPAPLTNNVDQTVCSTLPGGTTYTENLIALQPSINPDGTLTFSWHTSPADALANVNAMSVATASAFPLANGIPVFVRVSNGICARIQAVTYTVNRSPSVTAAITSNYNGAQLSCNTSSNGIITVTPPTNGTTPYLYSIDGSSFFTSTTFNGLSASGNPYVVRVRDAKGCIADSPPLNFVAPVALTATISITSNFNGQHIQCRGDNNGQITVVPSGGTGTKTFSILELPGNITGVNSGTFTGLTAGSYTVVVKDANNCQFTTATVTLIDPPAITATAVLTTPVSCNGLSDGVITVTASGGTLMGPTYTYTIFPGGTSNSTGIFSGLAANTYTVNVTDDNTCVRTSNSVTVTQPSALTAFASVTSNYNGAKISCPGANDAVITVTANGGNGGYSYVLVEAPGNTTGNATGVYTGIGPGTYTVSVTDSKTCNVVTVPVNITEPTPVNATGVVSSVISCNGGSDGEIRISATGGTGAYTFTMTSPAGPSNATGIFSGLAQGTYDFQVRDLNNCSDVVTVILTQPTAVTASATVTSNYNGAQISCNGANDGVITVTGSGGTGVLTYIFNGQTNSTGATTGVFTGVSAGTGYTFTVTDIKGCPTGGFVTAPIDVVQPVAITATAAITSNYNGQHIRCVTATDGEITVTASGGTGTLSYRLDQVPLNLSGAASGIFTGVGAGLYTVTVRDLNSCFVVTVPITVVAPPAIVASASVTSNYNGRQISCNGASDGRIAVTASGGVGAFSYVLSPAVNASGAASGVFTGLPAGSYTVMVTDGNGCQVTTASVTLSEPTAVSGTSSVTSSYHGAQISCVGSTDGVIRVTASGGTAPYTFISVEVPANVSGATTGIFTGLAAGSYTFTVRDANNCTFLTPAVVISPPSALSASALVATPYNGFQVSCNGASDGLITVSGVGGTGVLNYTFVQDPGNVSGATSGVFTGIGAGGPYQFTVSDANGCSVTTSNVTVTEPTSIIASAAVTSNYNGQHITCPGVSDGEITISASGGTGVFTYRLDQAPLNNSGNTDGSYAGVGAGNYTVTVRDQNGCFVVTSMIAVVAPTSVTATAVVTSNYNGRQISCNGVSDGQITVTAGGGVGGFAYVINPAINVSGATTGIFTALPAGTYTIAVRDLNNCQITTSPTTISQPDLLVASATLSTSLSCFNTSDAQVTASVVGGTANYTFSIDTSPVTTATLVTTPHIFTGIGPNAGYIVTVVDVNGCSDTTDPVAVIAPSQPLITASVTSKNIPAYHGQDITCYDADDAIITAVHTAGTGTGSLTFGLAGNSSGQFTGIFSQVGPGVSTITATDINGCPAVPVDVLVVEPPQLTATIISGLDYNGFDIKCFNEANGRIILTTTGGTGNPLSVDYKYSLLQDPAKVADLSNGDIRFNGLRANEYEAKVTDLNNCTAISNLIELEQPDVITMSIDITSNYGVDGTDISCNGASDGVVGVAITIEGGTGVTGGGAGSGIADYNYILNDRNGVPLTDNTNPGFTSGIFTGLTNQRYTVTAIDANACTQRSFPVTLVQPAVLQAGFIGSDQSICINQASPAVAMFEEISEPFGGNGSYVYQWKFSTSSSGPFTNVPVGGASPDYLPTVTPTVTTYYVREVSLSGAAASCPTVVSNPVVITVNELPTANITLSKPDPICEGGSFIVNMNFPTGALPFTYTYTTSDTDGNTGGDSGIGGNSLPIFVTDYSAETTFTLTSLVDRNGCVATTLPIDRTVSITKFSAEFSVLGPNPQCSGELFTFEHRNDNNVTYTFSWPDGTSRVVAGDGSPQPDTVRRSFKAFDPSQIAELPVLLKAEIAGCNPKTTSEIIKLYPAILPNIVVTEDQLCSGSAVQITNNTLGGNIHRWTITRTNDGVVESGFPVTDLSPVNKSFVIENTSIHNPATYLISYDVSNDPGVGNGSCNTSRSLMVDVYRKVEAKIGSPKNPAQPIQDWGENDPGDAGVMGVDAGKNYMAINFVNASTPAPPQDANEIEYKWVFSNNNINTPPETFISQINPIEYRFKNAGVGKKAVLTVTNLKANGNVPGGCSSTDQFIFEIKVPDPVVAFTLDPYYICLPDTITATNLSTPLFNVWTISNESKGGTTLTSNDFNPTFFVNEPGRYRITLKVRDPDLPDEEVFYKHAPDQFVDVYLPPDAYFVASPVPKIFIGQVLQTDNRSVTAFDEILEAPAPISYRWDFGDGTILESGINPAISDPNSNHSPTHKYESEQRGGLDIVLTAINDYGTIKCTSTDTVSVTPLSGGTSKIPNAFTPNPGGPNGGIVNEDGTTINDVFLPITKGVNEFKMQIFDRWGNLVFESTNKNQGWDGYDRNGNLMPAGVYVYKLVLRMTNDQRTTQVGDVTLIR